MALELRPSWCLDDSKLSDLVEASPWKVDGGGLVRERGGDDWKPGQTMRISRDVTLLVKPKELRRSLGLAPGARVGLAGRWACRATEQGGTHVDGPIPVPLKDTVTLTLDIHEHVGGSVELETCLVVKWDTDDRPPSSCPDGAMVWSDGWSLAQAQRTLLLEGSELRVPVRTVPFDAQFGRPSGALWAIDIDPSTSLEDVVPNVVTVLLNKEVLERDFKSSAGEADAALLPASAAAGIQVDLVRALVASLVDELDGDEDWQEMEEGTVGAMIVRYLIEAFGSVDAGLSNYTTDEPVFSRELWHRFAPTSWGVQ